MFFFIFLSLFPSSSFLDCGVMSVVGEEQLGSGVSIRRRSWQIEGVSEEGGLGRVFLTGRDVVSASEMVGERALH